MCVPFLPTFACGLGLPLMTVIAGPSSPAPTTADVRADSRIELVVLDIEGVDAEAFAAAVSTRLPDRRQASPGEPAARDGVAMWGYVQVRPRSGGWTLALILSDGRGYYREVARREGGDDPRLIANTLSNLVASVEEDALPADEEDVTIPDEAETSPPPATTPRPEPTPAAPKPEAPPPDPVVPAFEVGPYIGGLALLAIGPPSPTGLAGGGGELGVDLRLRNGATLGGGVRGLGATSAGFGLARVRAGLHGGYSWRKGPFELIAVAGVSVEPWFVRSGGAAENLRTEGGEARSGATALGGFARIAPGYRRPLRDGLALRIAPAIGIAGSSVLGAGGGVARVRDQGSDNALLFRVGGLELSGGIELGLWWAPRTRPAR